jgi:carbonic anhydrase/acetyltransferase-like protein (isoleucine patch superfamily)
MALRITHSFAVVAIGSAACLAGAPGAAGGAEPCEAGAPGPTFVDPTALVERSKVDLGECVYVAPFAEVKDEVRVGDRSNVQDSVQVLGSTRLGDEVILAHGASAIGATRIGETGTCPDPDGAGPDAAPEHCPSFVGFNSLTDGAKVEKDAMVTHLARVGPGVRIPSGRKVLPGMDVTGQRQVATKTAPVTEADRAFMEGVIHVNTAFAREYTRLEQEHPSNVRGANFDPGNTEFNPDRDLPTLGGVPARDPGFNDGEARIVGDVVIDNPASELEQLLGYGVSLRADEGEPFEVGRIVEMKNRTTFHALEHTHLDLGAGGRYGDRSLVHGGPEPHDPTVTGTRFTLGDSAVFFRSRAGDRVNIGSRSFVQSSSLPAGARVPPRTTVIGDVVDVGGVEW